MNIDHVLELRTGSSKISPSFPLQMWSATQSALCIEEKAHRAEHRWVLQLGKPLGNQHMDSQAATLRDSSCLCCATSAAGTQQGRACGHSCARGKIPRAEQGILSWCCLLAVTVQLSKIPQLWKGSTSSGMAGCTYSPPPSASCSAARSQPWQWCGGAGGSYLMPC